MKKFPNFLIIGAAKAGSTSLYEYLRQHPDIFLPENKEPSFFWIDSFYRTGFENYAKIFEDWKGQKRIGEASTSYSSYLGLEKTVKRIYEFNDDMKLIYILRNPIERAYSRYWAGVQDLDETRTFDEAIKIEEERTDECWRPDPWSYKRRGLYFYIISKYLDYFPRENLHIVLFDDLKSSPIKVCEEIFKFLGLDSFQVKKIPKQNPAVRPKNYWLHKMLTFRNPINSTIEMILKGIIGEKKMAYFIKTLKKKNLEVFEYPPMKEQTFMFLREYFENDVKNLEKLLKRDLTHWRESNDKLVK